MTLKRHHSAAMIAVSLFVTGCAVNTAIVTSPLAGLSCIDDTPNCIQKRQSTLRYLTNDPTRAWVRQRPTPMAYASGVRLFAFKKKKAELSCAELKIGKLEADSAKKVMSGTGASGLTPAQVSRGTMLATEVSRDLRREQKRRCKS